MVIALTWINEGDIMRFVSWVLGLIMLVTIAGTLGCVYAVIFFAWLSATPLSTQQLQRVRYDYVIWLIGAVIGCVLSITSVVVFLRNR